MVSRIRANMLSGAISVALGALVILGSGSTDVAEAKKQNPSSSTGTALITDACEIKDARRLSDGGDQDWSFVKDLLVFDQTDGAGVYQLRTIRPDGSGETCISCKAQPGAPRVDRHKLNPTWHASGQFIVLQAEMDSHPLALVRTKLTSELILNGLWTNLYAVSSDGARWYRLTDFSNTRADGALGPHFSADGSKLFWSRMVEQATKEHPFGVWRLQLADFVVSGGVPSLKNVRDITPPGATFAEAHAFSPDGRKVYFTADIAKPDQWSMDTWSLELSSGRLANLNGSAAWDEHASVSADGSTISYMSSQPYPLDFFRTELYVMRADGSSKRQLTSFNKRGAPGYAEEKNMPGRSSWSADGRRLAVTQQLGGESYPDRKLWVLTFSGACGAQAGQALSTPAVDGGTELFKTKGAKVKEPKVDRKRPRSKDAE